LLCHERVIQITRHSRSQVPFAFSPAYLSLDFFLGRVPQHLYLAIVFREKLGSGFNGGQTTLGDPAQVVELRIMKQVLEIFHDTLANFGLPNGGTVRAGKNVSHNRKTNRLVEILVRGRVVGMHLKRSLADNCSW
jgi:hypothetical protein